MELKNQRRLAAEILKCSVKKVRFNPENLDEIKEAITKADIKSLINQGLISFNRGNHISRVRARKRLVQKRKNNRRGKGRKKGTKYARLPRKKSWISKIRAQRELLKKLRDKEMIETRIYQELYLKAKGGFFRNKRHIKLYLEEQNLLKKKK
jgi:large subunit ribosomal protein L19e